MNLEVEEANVAKKALLGIPLFLLPAVSLSLGLPMIWTILPGIVSGRPALSETPPELLALSIAVIAAVLAVPGYWVAAFEEERLASMRAAGRWWIRSSLTAGIVAALVAVPFTFFFGRWLWIFPAGTLAACLYLGLRSERHWRSPNSSD